MPARHIHVGRDDIQVAGAIENIRNRSLTMLVVFGLWWTVGVQGIEATTAKNEADSLFAWLVLREWCDKIESKVNANLEQSSPDDKLLGSRVVSVGPACINTLLPQGICFTVS